MKKPNIILIMTDDHAAHSMSCYGSKINQTPNMDRIANEGMRFDNCYCTNSICAPSRAVILTGKHSHLNGVITLDDGFDNTQNHFAKILQKNDYQTAIIGKWHLGQKEENWPSGFDYWNVLPGQGLYHNPIMNEMGTKKVYEGYATDIITDLSMDWMKNRDKDKPFCLLSYHKAPHRPWYSDEKHKALFKEDVRLPDTFFDDYENRSEAAKNAYMRVTEHMSSIDLKIVPPKGIREFGSMPVESEYRGVDRNDIPEEAFGIPLPDTIEGYSFTTLDGDVVTFDSIYDLQNWKYQRYIKDYLRCVASVDDNIGRMLDYLDEEGIADDTIIMYTSDQGFFLGDHGWFDKRFMYEESLRMPFIARYPREIAAESVCDKISQNLDFAKTILDFAGLDAPDDMQGDSLRPLMQGETPEGWRTSFYYRYWMHLTHHNVPAHIGLRTERYKLIYYYGKGLDTSNSINIDTEPEWELFDLDNDPNEMKNVYSDDSYKDVVKTLTEEMYKLKEEALDNIAVQ